MFHSARLKLTAWYVVILMCISIFFSGIIYSIVSTQIEGLIHKQNERIEHFKDDQDEDNAKPRTHIEPPMISTEELEDQKHQLIITLVLTNGVILLLAGGAAYFLAGRTLRPIKEMLDEQNLFISSASHELRTPIATMRTEMESSLLEKHLSDKTAREILHSNLEELQSLQTLSNNLLTLAQAHTVNSLQFSQKASLRDILESADKKVQPLAKKKQITITKKLADILINGDKSSLTEAFVILLENAIKYSPDATEISIQTVRSRSIVKILVTDQGIGIAESDLPHIFERFYRADKSRSQDGFGLGLAIAKKTIDSHHGTIAASSTIGKGTTFTVILPTV